MRRLLTIRTDGADGGCGTIELACRTSGAAGGAAAVGAAGSAGGSGGGSTPDDCTRGGSGRGGAGGAVTVAAVIRVNSTATVDATPATVQAARQGFSWGAASGLDLSAAGSRGVSTYVADTSVPEARSA